LLNGRFDSSQRRNHQQLILLVGSILRIFATPTAPLIQASLLCT